MAIISIWPQKKLVPIPNLIRICLEFIYDRNSKYTAKDCEKIIIHWLDWVNREKDKQAKRGDLSIYSDTRPVGTKGTEIDEVEFWIMWCSQRLVQNEEHMGEVARNKSNILQFGLDYKKLYRFPEAYTPEDFARAMAYLKKAQDEHPEDYA